MGRNCLKYLLRGPIGIALIHHEYHCIQDDDVAQCLNEVIVLRGISEDGTKRGSVDKPGLRVASTESCGKRDRSLNSWAEVVKRVWFHTPSLPIEGAAGWTRVREAPAPAQDPRAVRSRESRGGR